MPPLALLDTLSKFPAVVAAIVGLPVALLAWWTNHQSSRRQATKAEVDAVCSAIAQAGDDEPYRAFLRNIAKEKLLSMAFGCSIPLDEIGRAMNYYNTGKTTTRQLGLAWEYRRTVGGKFTFKLVGWKRINLIFVRVYCWCCLGLAAVTTVLALLPIDASLRLQFAAETLLFATMAIGMVWMHRELYVADKLAKMEAAQ